MIDSIDIKTTIDSNSICDFYRTKFKIKNYVIGQMVLDDSNLYTPLDTGALRRSGKLIQSGITWDVRYAQRVYQPNTTIRIKRRKNRRATKQWFEVAKAKFMPKWIKQIQKTLTSRI